MRPIDDDPSDKKKKKTPDYVYDPGKQHGFDEGSVVIVEAKGSMSPVEAKAAPINRRARAAYKRQVKDFIGTKSQGLVVVNGYAIAFGAIPGTLTSRIAIASPQTVLVGPQPVRQPVSLSAAAAGSGMFVQLAQAQQKQQEQVEQRHLEQLHIHPPVEQTQTRRGGRGGGDDGGERRGEGERAQPSGRVAFANYENVFLLCGATNAATFLRRIISGGTEDAGDRDPLLQHFWLLDGPEPILFADPHPGWPFHVGIYEPSARSILKSAANNRFSPPPAVELPIAPVVTSRDEARRGVVMQGDGFAFVEWEISVSGRTWDLNKGDWV